MLATKVMLPQPMRASEPSTRSPAGSSTTVRDLVIGGLSTLWFFLLSGWLGVVPGAAIVERMDTFFSADTLRWLEGLDGRLAMEFSVRHPLKWFTAMPLGTALTRLATPLFGHAEALVLVGRFLNAACAGLGAACVLRATCLGRRFNKAAWIALAIYLLFSSGAIAAIPEHFGISNGLLSLTFLIAISVKNVDRKIRAMVPMGIIVGGTTLTNGLYPLGVVGAALLKRLTARRPWIAPTLALALIAGLTLVVIVGSRMAERLRGSGSVVMRATNLRLVNDPPAAALYAAHGLVDPAIAPSPRMSADPGMLTYEPARVWAYGPVRSPGVVSWVLLLGLSILACTRDDAGRRILWLTAPWIVFNLLFHNLWGDEFFLYSCHWSWCLGALLLAGAQRLPMRYLVIMGIPILVGQVVTLVEFRQALGQL